MSEPTKTTEGQAAEAALASGLVPEICSGTSGVTAWRDDKNRPRYVACSTCAADVTEPNDWQAQRVGTIKRHPYGMALVPAELFVPAAASSVSELEALTGLPSYFWVITQYRSETSVIGLAGPSGNGRLVDHDSGHAETVANARAALGDTHDEVQWRTRDDDKGDACKGRLWTRRGGDDYYRQSLEIGPLDDYTAPCLGHTLLDHWDTESREWVAVI